MRRQTGSYIRDESNWSMRIFTRKIDHIAALQNSELDDFVMLGDELCRGGPERALQIIEVNVGAPQHIEADANHIPATFFLDPATLLERCEQKIERDLGQPGALRQLSRMQGLVARAQK